MLLFLLTQSFFEYEAKIKFINHIKIIKKLILTLDVTIVQKTQPQLFLLLRKERVEEGRNIGRKEGRKPKNNQNKLMKSEYYKQENKGIEEHL